MAGRLEMATTDGRLAANGCRSQHRVYTHTDDAIESANNLGIRLNRLHFVEHREPLPMPPLGRAHRTSHGPSGPTAALLTSGRRRDDRSATVYPGADTIVASAEAPARAAWPI
jgi:hypothetical protein